MECFIYCCFFFFTPKRELYSYYISQQTIVLHLHCHSLFLPHNSSIIYQTTPAYIYIYILMIFIYSSLSSTLILQTFFIIKQSSQFPSSFIHFPHACNSNIQIASFIPFNSCYYYYYIGFTIFFFYPLNTILNIGSKDLLSIFKICRKLK